MTVRLQIRDAIIGRLNTGRPSDIPEATRRRAVDREPIQEPLIGVFLGDEQVKQIGGRWGEFEERSQQVFVQHRNFAERNEDLDDVVEPMLAWATRALGGAKQDLNGLALDIVETKSSRHPWNADRFYQVVMHEFVVSYKTRRDDQTLQS